MLKSILTYDHGEFLDEQASNDLIPLIINLVEMTNIPEYEEFCDAYLVRARYFSSELVPNDNRRDRQSLTDRINVVILMFRYQQLPNQQQQSAMIPSGVH